MSEHHIVGIVVNPKVKKPVLVAWDGSEIEIWSMDRGGRRIGLGSYEEYEEQYLNPWEATDRGYVDDVIDPAETRTKLIAGLVVLRSKREELPQRKHGNVPL